MSSQLGRCKAWPLGRLTLIKRGSASRFADRAGHRGLHSGPVLSVLNITVQTLFEIRLVSCGFRKLKCSFCWNVVRAVKHGGLRLKWRS